MGSPVWSAEARPLGSCPALPLLVGEVLGVCYMLVSFRGIFVTGVTFPGTVCSFAWSTVSVVASITKFCVRASFLTLLGSKKLFGRSFWKIFRDD